MLDRLFALKAHDTSVGTEVLAGVTTFLTMAYIVVVNPLILGDAGMPVTGVAVATCLAAAFGSLHPSLPHPLLLRQLAPAVRHLAVVDGQPLAHRVDHLSLDLQGRRAGMRGRGEVAMRGLGAAVPCTEGSRRRTSSSSSNSQRASKMHKQLRTSQ